MYVYVHVNTVFTYVFVTSCSSTIVILYLTYLYTVPYMYTYICMNVVFRSSSKNPEDVLYIKYKMYRYRSSRYLCVQMISLVLMWKQQLYCTNPLIFLYIQGYTSNQMVPVVRCLRRGMCSVLYCYCVGVLVWTFLCERKN